MSDKPAADAAPKKKGKLKKIIVAVLGAGILIGGGVGAGLYAAGSGLIGGGGAHAGPAEDPYKPKLVPKSEQKHAGEGGEGGEGGGDHGGGGEGEAAASEDHGAPTPAWSGG